jgi:hypothetical protein
MDNMPTNHVIVPITPNIRPMTSFYIERQRHNKLSSICNCSCFQNIAYRFKRLSTTQKYLVVFGLIFLMIILGGFGVALYVGIKMCIYLC